VEFAAHALNQHFELEFTNPSDNGLTGFMINPDFKGWIFFG
jgi:hypothetical protein